MSHCDGQLAAPWQTEPYPFFAVSSRAPGRLKSWGRTCSALMKPVFHPGLNKLSFMLVLMSSAISGTCQGRGGSRIAVSFQGTWPNSRECPISASVHEVYSCHWCNRIKSVLRQSNVLAAFSFVAQELESHLLVSSSQWFSRRDCHEGWAERPSL